MFFIRKIYAFFWPYFSTTRNDDEACSSLKKTFFCVPCWLGALKWFPGEFATNIFARKELYNTHALLPASLCRLLIATKAC